MTFTNWCQCVCVYYCRTYYKAVRGGTREEPGTLTQGAPVFPGSSRLGIEPKTPGWLVQDPTTRQIGDLIPTIFGLWTLEWVFRGNVGIHRAHKAIQVDGCRPRRGSWLTWRFPWLSPIRNQALVPSGHFLFLF